MSKYLVTGGAGFIGTNLVKQLLVKGDEVVVLDDYSGGRFPDRVQPNVKYVEGDIRNMEDINKVMAGVDGVFHLAAMARMPYSIENPQETNEINIDGTLNVLVSARDNGVKRLVYSASSSAYGEQKADLLVETMKPAPMSPYGLQKYVGEEYCRLFYELYKFNTVSLRYFNLYGPHMDPEGAYALVVAKFLKQIKEGKPMTICGDGEYLRDYIHVYDVAKANILAMESEKVGHGEVMNVGNGKPYTVNDVAKLIGGDYVYVDPRPGDPRSTMADITLIKKLLGWEPTITLEEGVAELKKQFGL